MFRKAEMERELDDELRFHLEKEVEQNLARGMSPEEARLAALRSFGGVERVKEESRDVRGVRFVEELWQDLQYGLRVLLKSKGFTVVAVLSLALGIGANTALFSVMDAVLLRTLPVAEPERLVVFAWYAGLPFRVGGMSGTSNVPKPPGTRGLSLFRYEVFDKMRQARAAAPDSPLSDLFAFAPLPELTAASGDQAETINGQAVTGGYYAGLGVQPSLGRAINDEDDKPGATPVVVLSHQFWHDRLGANPSIIGQPLKLNK
ncbi:MAG TPA: permease prefix domain 1-containing protein, partial [Blastocatellia bacterium]|nr:permease prefix domain 1-containing protein [Blastocatellia bacterium]